MPQLNSSHFVLVLHNPKRDGHVIDNIPEIAPTSFLEVCRQPSERFSDIVGDLLDLKIGTYPVIGWKLEILKRIFRNIANMRRVSEGTTRCVIGNDDLYCPARARNAIHLFHQSNQVANMLNHMPEPHHINRIRSQRQGLFYITYTFTRQRPSHRYQWHQAPYWVRIQDRPATGFAAIDSTCSVHILNPSRSCLNEYLRICCRSATCNHHSCLPLHCIPETDSIHSPSFTQYGQGTGYYPSAPSLTLLDSLRKFVFSSGSATDS